MSKVQLKNLIAVTLALILSTLIVSIFIFGTKKVILDTKETTVDNWVGEPITAISISDLSDRAAIPFANYTPNKFLIPYDEVGGEKISIDRQNADTIASSGTYQFVVTALDPMSEDFDAQAKKLEKYKGGDGNFHFTLFLPQIWSACAVYVDSMLIKTVGDISNYDLSNYSQLVGETSVHSEKTQPLYVDLILSSQKELISPNPLESARIVTIHYETEIDGFSGLKNKPLIGKDSNVRGLVSTDTGLLTALCAITALVLVAFSLLCFMKRKFGFSPQLFIGFGILGFILSKLLTFGATAVPLFAEMLGVCSIAFLLLASLCSLRPIGKLQIAWYAALAVAVFHTIFPFLYPILSLPSTAFYVYNLIASITISSAVLMFLTVAIIKQSHSAELLVNPTISIIIAITTACTTTPILYIINPAIWLSMAVVAVILSVSVHVFYSLERRNRYLTANLQTEVARQTQNLDAIISERNKILTYVSHDMKKTSVSMGRFLGTLREREKEPEQIKTIDIISAKNQEMTKDFTELSHYSKLNYFAEPSTEVNATEIATNVFSSLTPDCEANGIVFQFEAGPAVRAWAKPEGLAAVLKNLVFNAIEHSGCKTITLTTRKKKNLCIIEITDDGKGISQDRDVFKPYYSENHTEDNLGLGLYLCKNLMTAMGGDLYYTQLDTKLTFTVTVPLA